MLVYAYMLKVYYTIVYYTIYYQKGLPLFRTTKSKRMHEKSNNPQDSCWCDDIEKTVTTTPMMMKTLLGGLAIRCANTVYRERGDTVKTRRAMLHKKSRVFARDDDNENETRHDTWSSQHTFGPPNRTRMGKRARVRDEFYD